MVALDTNVIVRYIAQDDNRQSKIATHIFEEVITEDNHGFLTAISLCETLWVLKRAYDQPKETLIKVLETLLQTDFLELEHRDLVWGAIEDFRNGKADFSDYFLARIGKRHGASTTFSFDANALKAKMLFTPAEQA